MIKIKLSLIIKGLDRFFQDFGFKNLSGGCFEKSQYGVTQSIFIYKSRIDESIYVEAHISITGKNIGIGGRVSNVAVDYWEHSYSGTDNSLIEQVKKLYLTVIQPWFHTYSNANLLMKALQNHEIETIKKSELDNIKISGLQDKSGQNYSPLSPVEFVSRFDNVVNYLKSFGFNFKLLYDSLYFFRKRNDIWDIVDIIICSNGVFGIVQVATWIPEIEVVEGYCSESCPDDFEDILLLNGGFVNQGKLTRRPDVPLCFSDIDGLDVVSEFIINSITDAGFNFFESINNKSEFVDSVLEEYKTSSYFEDIFLDLKK